MPEYIDREAAVDAVRDAYGDSYRAEDYIRAIPAADVKPVVRGKWIDVAPNGWLKGKKYCSHCKGLVRSDIYWMYCPQCGAEMEAGNG